MSFHGAAQPIFSASHSAAVSWTSEFAFKTDEAKALSAQLVWTNSSFSGSFNIEVSNDGTAWTKAVHYLNGLAAIESTFSGTAGSPALLTIPDYCAKFARLKFSAAAASTGSLGTTSNFYAR